MMNTHSGLRKFMVTALAVLTAVAFLGMTPSYAAKKLKVSPTKKTIYVGKTVKLKANQKVKWSVKSGKTIVKLSSKKSTTVVVKGLKKGSASVTAKAGKQSKTVKFTVKKKASATSIVKAQPAEKESKVYVSAAYVRAAIAGKQKEMKNPVVLEVGWGTEKDDADYGKSHIPGAIHFNTDWAENNELDGEAQRWDIRSFDKIKAQLVKLGITTDTPVIVYANGKTNSGDDRVAFALLWAGVKNVKSLDGGYEAWTKAGYPTETKSNTGKSASAFGRSTAAHPEWIVDTNTVTKADSKYKLVSIRSYEEYIGQTSGYGYIDKAGEPKGAIWGHDTDDGSYTNADGTAVGPDTIAKYIQPYGATLDDNLAFYCGTGWRATIPFLIMYQNGYNNMYLYDDGWFVYNQQKNLPVQLGDPAKGNVTYTTTDQLPETYTKLGGLKYAKDSVTATATGKVENELSATDGKLANNVTYKSSNEDYVTVAEDGTVTVNKMPAAGSTTQVTITATGIPEIADSGEKHATASYTITLQDRANAYTDSAAWSKLGITYDEYKKLDSSKTQVLDLRQDSIKLDDGTDIGFNAGHLKGAVQVACFPLSTADQENLLTTAIKDKKLDSSKKIVVICRSGNMGAKRAMSILKENGFKDVTYIIGGAQDLLKNHAADLVK